MNQKSILNAILLLLPLAITVSLNLVGTFMSVNLHDFKAFEDADRAVVSG